MGLRRIEITTFRNIQHAALDGFAHSNIVFGKNGSGKTSFLEAIYFATMAKSFRTPNVRKLIKHDADLVRVVASFSDLQHRQYSVGIERGPTTTQIRIDGKPVQKKSELVRLLPVQLVDPDSHHLLELGPVFRRQMIDWGVFHVEHRYIDILKAYMFHLRQRNHLLRNQASAAEIHAWSHGLAETGEKLHQLRSAFMESLSVKFQEVLGQLLGIEGLDIRYYPGWGEGKTLEDSLQEMLASDQARGYTQSGPHRCDLQVRLGAKNAKEIISRGQQKLLICALKIAQMFVIEEKASSRGILLVDDLPAELDGENRAKLMSYIAELPFQSFITTTDPDSLAETLDKPGLFHVELGALRPLTHPRSTS